MLYDTNDFFNKYNINLNTYIFNKIINISELLYLMNNSYNEFICSEDYDGLNVYINKQKYLITDDGGKLLEYQSSIFNNLPNTNLKIFGFISRFSSETSFECFKGIPQSLKVLILENLVNFNYLKFKHQLYKVDLYRCHLEDLIDDITPDEEDIYEIQRFILSNIYIKKINKKKFDFDDAFDIIIENINNKTKPYLNTLISKSPEQKFVNDKLYPMYCKINYLYHTDNNVYYNYGFIYNNYIDDDLSLSLYTYYTNQKNIHNELLQYFIKLKFNKVLIELHKYYHNKKFQTTLYTFKYHPNNLQNIFNQLNYGDVQDYFIN